MSELKFGLLVSGELGNICLDYISKKYDVRFVFTDRKSSDIQNYCTNNEIALFVGNPRNQSEAVQEFLRSYPVDHILSINYLFLVGKEIINHPNGLIVNFHGSLLPKYRGRTPHVWAIINGEELTGVTAHQVVEDCDAGAILMQRTLQIYPSDTGFSVISKFKYIYIEMLEELLCNLNDNNFIAHNRIIQDETKATYFGKRTPEDGQISWDWFKKRISDWVRAQAYPYPGAYSYSKGRKLIVDKVAEFDFGFDYQIKNGTILAIDPIPLVKVGNGVLGLTSIRNLDFELHIGEILEYLNQK